MLTRSILLISILASAACAGKRADSAHLPPDPAAAVQDFLAAVKANDLEAMGSLWGSDRGPANEWMKPDELQKRLTVIRSMLVHDGAAIEPGTRPGSSPAEARALHPGGAVHDAAVPEPVDRGRHRPRSRGQPGPIVPVGPYSVSSSRMPAVDLGCRNAMRCPP